MARLTAARIKTAADAAALAVKTAKQGAIDVANIAVTGRGLHSFTFWLNLSAFCG